MIDQQRNTQVLVEKYCLTNREIIMYLKKKYLVSSGAIGPSREPSFHWSKHRWFQRVQLFNVAIANISKGTLESVHVLGCKFPPANQISTNPEIFVPIRPENSMLRKNFSAAEDFSLKSWSRQHAPGGSVQLGMQQVWQEGGYWHAHNSNQFLVYVH